MAHRVYTKGPLKAVVDLQAGRVIGYAGFTEPVLNDVLANWTDEGDQPAYQPDLPTPAKTDSAKAKEYAALINAGASADQASQLTGYSPA